MAAATRSPATRAKRLLARRKSLLDFVGRNLTSFKTRVAREDKPVIDGHLQGIRELETRLASTASPTPTPGAGGRCAPDAAPMPLDDTAILSTDKLYPDILRAYIDMTIAALRCGVTRVVTLQTGDCSGNSVNFGAFVDGHPGAQRGRRRQDALPQLARPGPQPGLGRRRPQGDRRQVVHGRVRRRW